MRPNWTVNYSELSMVMKNRYQCNQLGIKVIKSHAVNDKLPRKINQKFQCILSIH